MSSHASRAGVIGVDHPRSGIDSGVANWRRLESSPTVLGIPVPSAHVDGCSDR